MEINNNIPEIKDKSEIKDEIKDEIKEITNKGIKEIGEIMTDIGSGDIIDLLNIDKYLKELETGDILLFHGSNYWISYFIELFTRSEISHVGMILKNPTYIDPSLNKGYYMLESGQEMFPDAIEHRIQFGVQIVNLKKVIEGYQGSIYVRKFNIKNRKTIEAKLKDIWLKIKDLPYDENPWNLLRVLFGLEYGNMERRNKFFCSALLTFILDQLELFQLPIKWDSIIPENYNDKGKIESLLKPDLKLLAKAEIK